jgi:hypothetical protein
MSCENIAQVHTCCQTQKKISTKFYHSSTIAAAITTLVIKPYGKHFPAKKKSAL